MIRRPVTALAAAALSTCLLIAGVGATSAEGSPTWKVTPVIPGGLNSPRGLAFDHSGALYVAEAGKFDRATVPAVGFGATKGSVDKFRLGENGVTKVWSSPIDGIADTFIAPQGEVLGAAGLTVADGHVLAIVGESQKGIHKEQPALSVPQMGHLLSLNRGNGDVADKANIGDQEYTWADQNKTLWKEFPDSNPTDVLVTRDEGSSRTFVIDAGANTLSEVMPNGTNRVIAYIPNDPVRDSTPTCVTKGPDGALYIGTLDLLLNFPPSMGGHGPGHSHVYRVDPDTHESFLTAAHVWASGLTTVYGCTFDREGNFWATEMFQPNQAGPPGDVVRIPFEHPQAVQHIGGTPLPGGIKQGPDGGMYVATFSPVAAPAGGVVKVSQSQD